jgi:hypothetical protein
MKEQFKAILTDIDPCLPSYFLVKGGRLQVAPPTAEEYKKLVANGYEPLGDVEYSRLDKGILGALTQILNGLGNRAILLFPLAVSAILAHEASREGSDLYKALRGSVEAKDAKEAKEDKRQKRKRE